MSNRCWWLGHRLHCNAFLRAVTSKVALAAEICRLCRGALRHLHNRTTFLHGMIMRIYVQVLTSSNDLGQARHTEILFDN